MTRRCRFTLGISESSQRPGYVDFTKADMCSALVYVCFGSKADMCAAKRHVRFTPNSDRDSGHEISERQRTNDVVAIVLRRLVHCCPHRSEAPAKHGQKEHLDKAHPAFAPVTHSFHFFTTMSLRSPFDR